MKKINSCEMIVRSVGATWSKKDVFDVLAFGDWGVVALLNDDSYTVFHIPSGLPIKHIDDKKYAKMLAKKLSKSIKNVWNNDGYNGFLNWYMELMCKISVVELEVGLFQVVDLGDVHPHQDIPF